ncbi:MAG: carbohydrate ABC transporter permease [Chloroflexota bacterium]|nr:carbohydrate ABC transporter permease [Chloroflexota bacterium]
MNRHRSPKQRILAFAHGCILLVACLVVLVPLAYLLINSVKLPREFLTVPPTILPTQVTFEHYAELFEDSKTLRHFRNSLTVTLWTTGVTIITGTLAAYGLARMRLSAKILAAVTFVFLFIRFYPRVTTVIPFFLVMRELDLLDTVWAIIIGQLGITIPFVTWLMLVVFQDLPAEIEEAAIVDGASVWQRFWRVVLPIVMPSVSAAAILTAFLSWNEFLIASSVARRKASVLSIAVAGFVSDKGIQWGPMAAMSVVMIVPMIIFALFAQKYLIRGITFGAVKG